MSNTSQFTQGILQSKAIDLWNQWDRFVSKTAFSNLEALGFEGIKDPSPVNRNRLFVKSPTPLVSTMVLYLVLVFLGVMYHKAKGGSGEKKSDPMVLRLFVQCHNLFLIVLSAYMCGGSIYEAAKNKYNFWGTGYKAEEEGMANVIYVFYVSKIYEYLDTIVMLLKGNIRQVSFLHVYHHISISFIWWLIAMIAPGGEAWYSCALNSLVHVIMYTYYFLASFIGKDEKKRRKYLWWGKYMTQFQMFQFITMMCQASYCYYYSEYPQYMSNLLFWYMVTLLVLFANFYIKKYFLGTSKQKKQ